MAMWWCWASETAIKAANDERGGFLEVTKVL